MLVYSPLSCPRVLAGCQSSHCKSEQLLTLLYPVLSLAELACRCRFLKMLVPALLLFLWNQALMPTLAYNPIKISFFTACTANSLINRFFHRGQGEVEQSDEVAVWILYCSVQLSIQAAEIQPHLKCFDLNPSQNVFISCSNIFYFFQNHKKMHPAFLLWQL